MNDIEIDDIEINKSIKKWLFFILFLYVIVVVLIDFIILGIV